MEVDLDLEDLKKLEKDERDRSRLLEVFPEELWVQVFEACDSDTLIACSNASSFSRELLEPKRSVYLFSKVLNILAGQKCLTQNNSADLLQLRLVCKTWRLGVNALLETPSHQKPLRIENYRHNRTAELAHPTYFRLYLSDPPEKWDRLETELLPQLDSLFYNDGSSPFPSRTLEIFGCRHVQRIARRPENPNYRQQVERYLSLVEHLLNKAGHHFWNATISFANMRHPIPITQWYRLLCKFANQMPNLKALYINNGYSFGGYGLSEINDGPQFPELKSLQLVSMENIPKCVMKAICSANSNLKVCIASNLAERRDPLPVPAGALRQIAVRYIGHDLNDPPARARPRLDDPQRLRDELERRARARARFRLRVQPPAVVQPPAPLEQPVRNLDYYLQQYLQYGARPRLDPPAGGHPELPARPSQVSIDYFDFGCLQDPQVLTASLRETEYFEKLPEHWNLKVLRVDLSSSSTLKLPAIFKKLETYKKTLTEVQISVANAASEDDKLILWESSRTPLHLPKVTRLEMEVRNICSLDFLVGLMSLEHLIFEANHNDTTPPSRGTQTQQIDFKSGYVNRSEFMKCNIWNYIPSLKTATIMFARGTPRHDYRRGEHMDHGDDFVFHW